MKNLFLFLKGIVVGIANIIPGVSGGTLAVVLNIFDELIFSINNLFKDFKTSIKFLLPIGLGAVFGIIAFSSIINFGLQNFSMPTSMFFCGLVVGSIPLIYGNATSKPKKSYDWVLCLIATGIVIWLSLHETSSASAGATASSALTIKLLLAGIVASSAMIIPGISGSFLLILMGMYSIIIGALADISTYLTDITNTDLLWQIVSVIAPLGIGVVIGIFLVSKIISVAFEKAYTSTYHIILGLIFGSVFSIFTSPETYASGINLIIIFASIITFIVGLVISLRLGNSNEE